jgi:hypothetical protein
MTIDIPILEGEDWWASQAIDDTDSLIKSLLALSNSCINLRINLSDSINLHDELSLHNDSHNIELDTDKWLAFCHCLAETKLADNANEVENLIVNYVSKHLKSRS